ncbi:MAG: NACHT domain-containing protein [Elainella sp.]
MNSQEALAIIESTLSSRLSRLQKTVFLHAWEDFSYPEIADRCGYELGYIKQTGSQLWQMLSQAFNEKVTKQNVQHILQQAALRDREQDAAPAPASGPICDWGGATDAQTFWGRKAELTLLEQWVQGMEPPSPEAADAFAELHPRCRLIGLFGMGGIGKTSLSVRLAKQLIHPTPDQRLVPSFSQPFSHLIWRSLRNAPPLEDLLTDLIQFLSNQQLTLSASLDGQIRQLLACLRQRRCLIILDNAETILQQGDCEGGYLPGYEGYGQLWHWIGEADHQSMLILTSRERPREIAAMAGAASTVRMLHLTGLSPDLGQKIFKHKGEFSGSEQSWQILVDHYAGNPLALKMVAAVIQDLFNGEISEFLECLQAGTSVFGGIQDLLAQQFQRLSPLEQQVMFWLAIVRRPISLSELRSQVYPPVPLAQFLEALTAVERRSLLDKVPPLPPERTQVCFTLQPVVMEYVTERLLQQICQEVAGLATGSLRGAGTGWSALVSYALIQADAPDYIRETQMRLILQPVTERLLKQTDQGQLVANLQTALQILQRQLPYRVGYAAGNLVNLLCQLGVDLSGWDFSGLPLWHAYLKGVPLHQVNLSRADLSKTLFTEIFSQVLTVAFSPDAKWLATGDVNHEIRLWQVADGKQLWSCRVDPGWVWAVAFSPDGKWLASCANRTVNLWQVATGELAQSFSGYRDRVFSVAFSPDSQLLATGSEDHLVRVWEIRSGQLLHQLSGHRDEVRSVAFCPNRLDGSHWQLVSGSYDGDLRLWAIGSQTRELRVWQAHPDWIWSVAFSPDGATLASAGNDGDLKLWQVETGICLRSLSHPQPVRALAFSPDGRTLASGSTDHLLRLWDYQTGDCLRVLTGHKSWISALAFSPEQGLLASGSEDQSVILWDGRRGLCLKTLRGYSNGVWSVAFDPSGTQLASGSQDRLIRLWDWQTGQVVGALVGHTNWVWSVAFCPTAPLLASGSEDQTIRLWDTRRLSLSQTLSGHRDAVLAVLFSPDGQRLISGSLDSTIKLWDVEQGYCYQTLTGHSGGIWGLALSPDGRLLASCSQDCSIRLWDLASGSCLSSLTGHESWIRAVAFSPDQQRLVSSGADGTIKLWDWQTGICLLTIPAHQGAVLSVLFHPGGEQFVSSGTDGLIKLWDAKTGECLTTAVGHERWVRFLTYSPEGLLASCSQDETVRLWQFPAPGRASCRAVLRTPRPYEGMTIAGATGLSLPQRLSLKLLGATES